MQRARPDARMDLPEWSKGLYLARAAKDVHDILGGAQGDFFLELEAAPELTEPAIDRACQLFEMMRDLCGETPVVVLSTRGAAADKKRAAELGANAYLVKTEFRESDLEATLRRFIPEGAA